MENKKDDVVFLRHVPVTYRGLTREGDQPDTGVMINLPKPTKLGVTRDAYVQVMYQLCKQQRPIVLVGGESVGKTSLMADYIHKYRQRSQDVIWLSANGQPWLGTQFYQVVRDPQWVAKVTSIIPPASDLPAFVYRALNARGTFIVAIDDAIPADISSFLPPANMAPFCRVLLSSRLPASFWRGFDVITVGDLTANEVPRVFLREEIKTTPLLQRVTTPLLSVKEETVARDLGWNALLLAIAAGMQRKSDQLLDALYWKFQKLKAAKEERKKISKEIGKETKQNPPASTSLTMSECEDTAVMCIDSALSVAIGDSYANAILGVCSLLGSTDIPATIVERITAGGSDAKAEEKRAAAMALVEGLALMRETTWQPPPPTGADFKTVKPARRVFSISRTVQTAIIFHTNLNQRLPQTFLQAIEILTAVLDGKQKVSDADRVATLPHAYMLLALAFNLKALQDTKPLLELGKIMLDVATLLMPDSNFKAAVDSLLTKGTSIELSMTTDTVADDNPYFASVSWIMRPNYDIDVFWESFIAPILTTEEKAQRTQRGVPQSIMDVDDKIEPFFLTDYCPLPLYPKPLQTFVDLIRAWLHGQFCAVSGDQKIREVKERREVFVKEMTQSSLHHSFDATSHAHSYLVRVIGKIASYFTTYHRRIPQFGEGAVQLLDMMQAFGMAGRRMFHAFGTHELGQKPWKFELPRQYGPVNHTECTRLLQDVGVKEQKAEQATFSASVSKPTTPSTSATSSSTTTSTTTEAAATIAEAAELERRMQDLMTAVKLREQIRVGSHISSRSNNDYVFPDQWRAQSGSVWGGPMRMNRDLLEWAQKYGKTHWFALTDNAQLEIFVRELNVARETKQTTVMAALCPTSKLMTVEMRQLFEREDRRLILGSIFMDNVIICAHAIWHVFGCTNLTADNFVEAAIHFLKTATYRAQALNYTRTLRVHHLYHLYDLLTDFGTSMTLPQFVRGIGYLMVPNTTDSMPVQAPDSLAQVLDLLFPSIVLFKESSAANDIQLRLTGHGQTGGDSPRAILQLSSPRVEIMAGKLYAHGLNLDLVVRNKPAIEPAYSTFRLIYRAMNVSQQPPTVFMNTAFEPHHSLSFVPKMVDWLCTHLTTNPKFKYPTAAPPSVRMFNSGAIGRPHTVTPNFELMRAFPTELHAPPDLRNMMPTWFKTGLPFAS